MPQEEPAPRRPVVAKPAVPVEPKDLDLEEEMVDEELEMEGDVEEDVQEELDLDADDDNDDFIEKSEDLLDDHDDFRNS
jgi:hypothetical protein